jgi:hypothetical protein
MPFSGRIMKRSVKIEGTDIELVITRAVEVKVEKPLFYLWELNDGTWRLEYSPSFIGDMSTIDCFRFNTAPEAQKKKKGKYPTTIEVIATTQELTDALIHQRLEIDRVIGITGARGSRFIHLEYNALKRNWSLAYWQRVIPDISKVTGFKIIRED